MQMQTSITLVKMTWLWLWPWCHDFDGTFHRTGMKDVHTSSKLTYWFFWILMTQGPWSQMISYTGKCVPWRRYAPRPQAIVHVQLLEPSLGGPTQQTSYMEGPTASQRFAATMDRVLPLRTDCHLAQERGEMFVIAWRNAIFQLTKLTKNCLTFVTITLTTTTDQNYPQMNGA